MLCGSYGLVGWGSQSGSYWGSWWLCRKFFVCLGQIFCQDLDLAVHGFYEVIYPEVGRSWRILSILLAADTTSSMLLCPNFLTSTANGLSRTLRNASTACLSAASSSRGCKRLVSFSASPANSIISLEPLFSCLSEAHASSLTDPAPSQDSKVSLAASQVASSSRLVRILLPVAPINS